MRSRAIVGLFVMSVASPLAYAHGPGVSHSYENGQPVITVRLVPDEATVANAKRIDALQPGAAHTAPSDEIGAPGVEPPVETLQPAAGEDFGAPVGAEQTNSMPTAENATPVSRYPTARPALKPNTEIGVGGVLDLAPPAAEETQQPRPMRLNSVQPRSRTVADRAPRPRVRQQPAKAPSATPAIDPLDEALPSRVIENEPAFNAMQLPAAKTEERLAVGN